MSLCLLVVNLGWKHVFDFLQKLAYFTAKNAANKLKRDVFSQIAIESVQNTEIQLKHEVLSEIWATKFLEPEKKL